MKRYILGNSSTCKRRFRVVASDDYDKDIVEPITDDPEIIHNPDGSTTCTTYEASVRYLHALWDSFDEGGINA